MKEILNKGASVFLKTIIINIMCFFVVISLSVLTTAAFTKNIGYKAIGTSSDTSSQTELYTYYYDDGEDTQRSTYESEGYTITESKIRSEMSGTGTKVFLIVSQIFCLLILIAFIYPGLWQLGTTDSNLVHFKHKSENKLKGFQIGLVAIIPALIFIIFLFVAKFTSLNQFPMVLYKFLNSSFYSFIELIINGTVAVGDLAIWRLVILILLQLLIPLICGASYLLGYKNISISERLIYKKNK